VATAQARSIYEIEVPRLDGKPAQLSEYEAEIPGRFAHAFAVAMRARRGHCRVE